jgi:predicted Zn-dependent protease
VTPPDDELGGKETVDPEADDDFDREEDGREEEAREAGYLWSFDRQEQELPEEYPAHMEILDDLEAEEILELDLTGRSDYILWAAAQSLEEQGRSPEAVDLLRRLAAGTGAHPALSYADIRLRLHDLLVERGDYEEALAVLDGLEREHPERKESCRERRAEAMVLSGRKDEGLRLFEAAASAIPDDPWVPLTAAWALVRVGDYDNAVPWMGRGERAARRLEDEQEARAAMAEVDRLRDEARARSARRALAGRPDTAVGAGFAERKQALLADLDAEEARLTRDPPRSDGDRQAAIDRLVELHRRASAAWDDAVERRQEEAIASLEELQWEVVELAERFGIRIPGTEE